MWLPAIVITCMNFLAAIDSRGKPVADIEQGYISTATCILANDAMKLGRDDYMGCEAAQRVINDAEANQLLRRPYRSPWAHPESLILKSSATG